MATKDIEISVEQKKDIEVNMEYNEIIPHKEMMKSYSDYNFTFNQENGKLELTMISNDGKEKTIEVDLPTEELVKNVNFDTENKQLVIEWENGQITNIPVDFMDEEFLNNYINNNSEKTSTIEIGTSDKYNINSDNEIPTTKAVKRIVNSNSSNPIIKITYDELKALRDNAQLIPGQQYRITDYETTTSQYNTRSAGHQFDIIVVADNENSLNENARACPHDGDTYFGGGIRIGKKYTGTFIAGITPSDILVSYTITYDQDFESYEGELKGGTDKIVELNYKEGTPVFYKNDIDYIESGEEGTDYIDEFVYNGQVEYEGETFDSWKKIEDGVDVGVTIYTNIVVENAKYTEIKETIPPVANLSTWELKYCLDNDTDRFGWASEYSIYCEDYEVEFQYIGQWERLDKVYSAWESPLLWEYKFRDTVLLTKSKLSELKVGDNVSLLIYDDGGYLEERILENKTTISQIKRGKGVIYYMKDERGNECYYDFKNIQFLRRKKDLDDTLEIEENRMAYKTAKIELLNTFSNYIKEQLSYGFEVPEISGHIIISDYYDGDYDGYFDIYLKKYICLDDPEYEDELYYLIAISDYEYKWLYTFTYKFGENDYSNSGFVRNNKILETESRLLYLPNIIFAFDATNNFLENSNNISICYEAKNSKILSSSGECICKSFNNANIQLNTDNIYYESIWNSKLNYAKQNLIGSVNSSEIGSTFINNIITQCGETKIGICCRNNTEINLNSSTIGNNLKGSRINGIRQTIGNNNSSLYINDEYNTIGNDNFDIAIYGTKNTIGNANKGIRLNGDSNIIENKNDTIHLYGNENVINNECRNIYFRESNENKRNIIGNNCANIGSYNNRIYTLKNCSIGNFCDSIYFGEGIYNNCVFGEKCHTIKMKASGPQLSSNIIQNVNVAHFCNYSSASKVIEIEPELEYVTVIKDANTVEMIINGEE